MKTIRALIHTFIQQHRLALLIARDILVITAVFMCGYLAERHSGLISENWWGSGRIGGKLIYIVPMCIPLIWHEIKKAKRKDDNVEAPKG